MALLRSGIPPPPQSSHAHFHRGTLCGLYRMIRREKSDDFVPHHLARSFLRLLDVSVDASIGMGIRAIGMVSETGGALHAAAKGPQLIFIVPGAQKIVKFPTTDTLSSEHNLRTARVRFSSFGALAGYRAPNELCHKLYSYSHFYYGRSAP